MVCQRWVSQWAGGKITSKEMQIDQSHTDSDLWPLGFLPSPAGNSAAEVSFEEPVEADLQTRGRPGTEVGGGCLEETERRQERKGSSLPIARSHTPQGTQWG